MNVQVNTAETDSFQMKYCKFGTGEKTAVILPGLSAKHITDSAESVASAYKSLSKDYTVYLFDRREICPENYTIKDMAEDTAKVFDMLNIKNAYVFGVSQGGMIAQYIAVNRPDLVSKLALCSTVSRITAENSGALKEWIKLAKQGDEPALIKNICEMIFSEAFNKKFGDFLLQVMGGVTSEELERFIILAKSCDGFDISERLCEIKCPVFTAVSKADKVFDYKETVFIAEKTNAELLVYEDYGHALYDEAPRFLDKLTEFFNK